MWKAPPADSKAAEVWLAFIDDDSTKYFLLEGAVRSSKTFGSILAWCDWVENKAPNGPLIMLGRTERTLKHNIIYPLIQLVGPKHARLNQGAGELTLFGRKIYLFGAPNVAAMYRLQGIGAVGAYCDEAPTYPYEVWQMLGTRTAADGIKIIATMNPDSPRHWMKVEYLNELEKINGRSWHFRLDDNPFLSEKAKTDLKRQYSGLWKLRYIDGLWVMAEGGIYNMFREKDHVISGSLPVDMWSEIRIGVDYGTGNPTCFLAIGHAKQGPHAGKWIVFKEYYYDGHKNVSKTDFELSKDMLAFLKRDGGVWYPSSIEVDPSAKSFREQLSRDGMMGRLADNAVVDGIRDVAYAMTAGKLLIHDSCSNLLNEIPGYVWDSKAQEKGEDMPVKYNDHCVDALRYACRRIFGSRLT
jgi:PBSX family phage terminase large subunit